MINKVDLSQFLLTVTPYRELGIVQPGAWFLVFMRGRLATSQYKQRIASLLAIHIQYYATQVHVHCLSKWMTTDQGG